MDNQTGNGRPLSDPGHSDSMPLLSGEGAPSYASLFFVRTERHGVFIFILSFFEHALAPLIKRSFAAMRPKLFRPGQSSFSPSAAYRLLHHHFTRMNDNDYVRR